MSESQPPEPSPEPPTPEPSTPESPASGAAPRRVVEPPGPVPELFIDGIAHAALQGGVVRLDFAHLSAATRRDDGQPALERNLRVICSVEGFVATYQTMQRLLEQLAAQGKVAVAPRPGIRVK